MPVSGSSSAAPAFVDNVKNAQSFNVTFTGAIAIAGLTSTPAAEATSVAINNPSSTYGLVATMNGKDAAGAATVLGRFIIPPSSQQGEEFKSYKRLTGDLSQIITSVTLNPFVAINATAGSVDAATLIAAVTVAAADAFNAIVQFNND